MEEVITELGLQWNVGIRSRDTPVNERQRQKNTSRGDDHHTGKPAPVTGSKKYADYFSSLKIIAVDEWHELLGSKRGTGRTGISRIVAGSYRLSAVSSQQSEDSDQLSAVSGQQQSAISKSQDHKTTNYKPKIPPLIWGISATIGNLEQAREVLHASLPEGTPIVTVKASSKKTLK